MKSSYSTLMQSKYFSPAFNSAIFDGPLRIYFAQFHESLALKIYFLAQQKLASQLQKAKEISRSEGMNILVMLYPTEDNFLMVFEEQKSSTDKIVVEKWNKDTVIGLRGAIEDNQLENLMNQIDQSLLAWNQPTRVLETADMI